MLSYQWIHSTDARALAEWDRFVRESNCGFYCHLTSWLASFQPYGFDFIVLAARDDLTGRVRGGVPALLIGPRVLRVMSVVLGPVADSNEPEVADELFAETLRFAAASGLTVLQMQQPHSRQSQHPFLLRRAPSTWAATGNHGLAIRAGAVPNQMLWVPFPESHEGHAWKDELLGRFDAGTRRNIRTAERGELSVLRATGDDDLRQAYRLIEQNGVEQGYATRSWEQFGPALRLQVERGDAVVLTAVHQGVPVGCHYSLLAGRRMTYMMGGTSRQDPNLKVGHRLHWEAMLLAKQLGLIDYDFCSGGSAGVMRFKSGFRPEKIEFEAGRHVVFAPIRFACASRLYSLAYRNRAAAAHLLSTLQRWRRGVVGAAK